jgi:large subunit ribosomal protein L3
VIEGLLGRKLGMLQLFDKKGRLRGATVIETGPCLVTQVRTEVKDGYSAVQLGFGAKKRLNKPERGHLKRLGDLRHLREFNVDGAGEHKVGDRLGAELFQEGDRVDVTATSKGRGFAGVVKRHHFAGGPKTHGQSDRHRAPGAIGAGNTPGRTFKGMRMAGHMGAAQVTVRNLEVLQTNSARGLIIVGGAVPGPREGLVKIRLAKETLAAVKSGKRKIVEPEVEEEATPIAEAEAPVAPEEEAPVAEAEAPVAPEEAPAAEATNEEESAGETAPAEEEA